MGPVPALRTDGLADLDRLGRVPHERFPAVDDDLAVRRGQLKGAAGDPELLGCDQRRAGSGEGFDDDTVSRDVVADLSQDQGHGFARRMIA